MLGKFSFSIGLFAILFVALAENSAWAAPPNIKWATARQIPGYPSYTVPPYLVADRNKTVHAFHVQPVNDQPAIVYSTWTMARGWTMPVDVLLAPNSAPGISFVGAFLDAKGIFHVIFVAGDETRGGDVYYSRAAAVDAGRVAAWSVPIPVGEKAIMGNFAVALTGDDAGNLFIFYSGKKAGNGLYEVYSRDGGDTWSDPMAVFLTDDSGTYPGNIALVLEKGELHIACVVWRPPYGGVELYYIHLDTDHNRMTSRVLLSRPITGNFTLPDSPAMIMYNDTLFLIYSELSDLANESMARLMRQSTDHGKSWSQPVRVFAPLIGGNGAATLLIDSNSGLHAVLANRAGDCCHAMWYSIWEGNRWSEPQAIINPQPKTRMFDPQVPEAVISQGNVILATWVHEERLNGVWYSYAKLDAPELPGVSLPTSLPSPTPTASLTTSAPMPTEARPTRLPVAEITADVPAAVESSSNISILIGVLPALALIALIGLWRTRH